MSTRQILINADNLNYTPGINAAFLCALENNVVSTTTAMMALITPHFPDPIPTSLSVVSQLKKSTNISGPSRRNRQLMGPRSHDTPDV